MLVPLARAKEACGGTAMVAGDGDGGGGGPVAAASSDGQGRGRSATRAAWRGEGATVIHSGGGRPEVGERRWPWSLAGRPWRWRTPVMVRVRERGAERQGDGGGGGGARYGMRRSSERQERSGGRSSAPPWRMWPHFARVSAKERCGERRRALG
jgi:hypothetical protein